MSERICGTGGWSGPQPGDPDNTATLHAQSVPQGILVSWSYPLTNPHAVAYVKVFRATNGVFDNALQVSQTSGDRFLDTGLEDGTTYYYWIRFVSIHGTEGEPIGYVTAVAGSFGEHVLSLITERIDESVLGQHLREKIDSIELNNLKITDEMIARAENDDALGVALNEIRANTDDAMAVLQEEVVARTTADGAIVDSVNTLYTQFNDNKAAVQNWQIAMASDVEALAQDVTKTEASLYGDEAKGEVGLVSKVDSVSGDVYSMWSAKVETTVDGQTLIGGFGVLNDGTNVTALFDVGTFAVGRTINNQTYSAKPFTIDGNNIYFNGAVSFSNITGAGKLAGKDHLDPDDLIDGTKAKDIRLQAHSGTQAKSKVDLWAYDNDTTYIDGGSIYTNRAFIKSAMIYSGAITNAKISNAAITSAKIGKAAVGTLKIAGNAVTVPTSQTNESTLHPPASWSDLFKHNIHMNEKGDVHIVFTASVGYPSGNKSIGWRIWTNGYKRYDRTTDYINDYVVISVGIKDFSGDLEVVVQFKGHSDVQVSHSSVLILGAKR